MRCWRLSVRIAPGIPARLAQWRSSPPVKGRPQDRYLQRAPFRGGLQASRRDFGSRARWFESSSRNDACLVITAARRLGTAVVPVRSWEQAPRDRGVAGTRQLAMLSSPVRFWSVAPRPSGPTGRGARPRSARFPVRIRGGAPWSCDRVAEVAACKAAHGGSNPPTASMESEPGRAPGPRC
jgi:hypothetical protein